MDDRQRFTEHVRRVIAKLPAQRVRKLAELLRAGERNPRALQDKAIALAADPNSRWLVKGLFEKWYELAPSLNAEAVAFGMEAALHVEDYHRHEQNVELVWTGPESGEIALRRTDQTLLEVIDGARERLLIVSFAVYKVQNILDALVRAAERGVRLSVVLESPEKQVAEQSFYERISALRDSSGDAAVYVWPRDKRETDASGRCGSLHVKCAVADGETLFLSSANLTGFAMNLNMELGVLIRGGSQPGRVQGHFARLIERGDLVALRME